MSQVWIRRVRVARLALLLAVPVLALAGWHACQPSDRLVASRAQFSWSLLLYDEYDLAAMAQRGLNAELGRQAGAMTYPPPVDHASFSQVLEAPRPLKPRYFLEYPHTMLLLFRAGYWVQPGWRDAPLPPGLPDCDYHNIAAHDPETEGQFAFWRVLVRATRVYAGAMFAAWVLLIVVLEWGYGAGLRGGAWLLLLPAAVYFTLNRYDVLPALFTALGFAALGRRRAGAAGLALGLAALLKVYPVLFVAPVLRYLWPQRREAYRFAAAFAATSLLAFAPLLAGADLEALLGPYKYQLLRPAEMGLTIYGCLLPADLAFGAVGGAFRMAALAAASVLAVVAPVNDLPSLLRRCALVLLVFVTLPVFYSPQWVLWFVPLLAPLARRDRRLAGGAAALDVVNYLTFPVWYRMPMDAADEALMVQVGSALRLARFVCCAVVAWRLLRPLSVVSCRFSEAERNLTRPTGSNPLPATVN